MNMKLVILFIIIALLPGYSLALNIKKEINDTSPHIIAIKKCGYWEDKKERGQYRIIEAYLYGHSEIYIQWVADPVEYPQKGQKRRAEFLIVKTVSLSKFNQHHASYQLIESKCVYKDEETELSLLVENADTDKKSNIKVKLFYLPGKYEYDK